MRDWDTFFSLLQLELSHLVGDALLFLLEAHDEVHEHLLRHLPKGVRDLFADHRLLLTATSFEVLLHEVATTIGDDRAFVGEAEELGVHAVRKA